MARSTSSSRIPETPEEIKLIKAGEKAIENLKRTFNQWMDIARALEAGREACLRAAKIDSEVERGKEGGAFARIYNQWLLQHPKLKLSESANSSKVIRSWLFKCLQYEAAILAWRSNQTVVEQTRYSFPETVFKQWSKDTDFVDPDAKPKKPRKKKQDEKQRDEQLDWARQRIKELVDEAGDWDNDSPAQIVEKLEGSYPDKANEVASLLLGEDRATIAELDWTAPEDTLVETLLGLLPQDEKAARVLRKVLERIESLVLVA